MPLAHFIRLCLLVWRLTFDKRVPLLLRALVPGALLYLLWPFDLLRDRIPILGWLDDLLIIILALWLLVKLAPRQVVEEHLGRHRDAPRPQEADPSRVVEGSARFIDEETHK